MSDEAVSRPDVLDLDRVLELLPQAENPDFWRDLAPDLALTDAPFHSAPDLPSTDVPEMDDHLSRLAVEGYFQTRPVVDENSRREVLRAIEVVRAAGYPASFALVYDAFYRCFAPLDPYLRAILGPGYLLVPNAWIYYLAPSEQDYGYYPHRDSEYPDTIGADGLPKILNAWFALTDATPLNGCMYILPAHRDPDYEQVVEWARRDDPRYREQTSPKDLNFQDLRALPADAGTVSFWNLYVYHWGGRSSRHGKEPRISVAIYFQRGDIPVLDPAAIDLKRPLTFPMRLGIILRAMRRYTNAWYTRNEAGDPITEFARPYIEALERQRTAEPNLEDRG